MTSEIYTSLTESNRRNLRVYDLVINSQDRDNFAATTASNFRIQLINPINQKIVSYALKSATIPKTTYNIAAGRNTFQITDSGGLITITIPPGNYGLTTYLTTIQNALNAASPDIYTVVIDPITAKITITSGFAGFVLNPNATLTLGGIPYQLGFDPAVAYPSIAGVLVAPGVVDIVGIKNAYIRINQLPQYMRNTTNNFMNFKIDWDGCFGNIIYFADNNKYHQYFNVFQGAITNLRNLDITLMDEYGLDLDLNGSDWSFVLQLITQDWA